MDFCYVWLRQLVSNEAEGFDRHSTRSADELTGNITQARGMEHFADGLAAVYAAMAYALKPGAPLAFTFHHNRIEAYHAVAVAIFDAGLICYAPCPVLLKWAAQFTFTALDRLLSIPSLYAVRRAPADPGKALRT